MTKQSPIDMQDLARRGAIAEVEDIRARLEALGKVLGKGVVQFTIHVNGVPAFISNGHHPLVDKAAPVPKRRRKRSHMSAAARKAVSVRMKKYWAARRKEAR